MDRPLTNIEFFTFEGEVWYIADGQHRQLRESDNEVIRELIDLIATFYPKAYKALCEEYSGCAGNKWVLPIPDCNKICQVQFCSA